MQKISLILDKKWIRYEFLKIMDENENRNEKEMKWIRINMWKWQSRNIEELNQNDVVSI